MKTLSGGQQRRLDVGLGIVGNPELLFLDEPTTGLDPSGRRESWDLIRNLAAEGTTVLLTTHYMDEVEALADRVAVLSKADIVATGTPSSLGGRDSGAGDHPLRPSRGVRPGELPVAVDTVVDGWSRSAPRMSYRCSHALTGWALEQQVRLPGLSVARVTLEDVYLRSDPGRINERRPTVGVLRWP